MRTNGIRLKGKLSLEQTTQSVPQQLTLSWTAPSLTITSAVPGSGYGQTYQSIDVEPGQYSVELLLIREEES